MAKPFRFGVQCSKARDASQWARVARKAEDLGFSTLFMPDHFGDQLAPVPALMAAADATTTLRVGTLVFDNDYKHPAVLAKEVATLDVLSGGRVELGLGAGWMRSDYEQLGIPYDEPKVRVDRFVEGLAIVKGLLRGETVTHAGEHYSITALPGLPVPVQRPHPPVLIGGGGKRMLTIAAREADIVGVNPQIPSGHVDMSSAQDSLAPAYDRKVAWVREAAGDRIDDIELNCLLFFVAPTDDRDGTATNLSPLFGITPEEMLDVPIALMGTVDQMCDTLEARRERWGLSYICVQGDAMDAIAPVIERLDGK